MRYTEFTNAHETLEGRKWTATDDSNLLAFEIGKADNVRGLFPYAQNIHLTNAVKLLAMRPDCKWFFDFLTTQLHFLAANGVKGLCFYVNKHDDELKIWAREDVGKSHIYPNKLAVEFPLNFVTLRAVREGNLWHVSLRQT
jgi:hypothetical protein